ncbi:MAG TPA: 50S ribosomal protein L9 [candidate division Zixibacteria bacterium]|nr:50S ribosomal protein L9 [candidate division Zixibacteria bacterium]
MMVLLREDVDNLGYAGEVLKVADGYGRNFLIPRGLAVKASPGVLKQAESWRERAAVRLAELRREHEALALKINNTNLNFFARAGETGKLYGSVTTADITDQMNELLGTDVDRRLVAGGPLRQLGEHRITVRLSRDYQPQVIVQIHPHNEVEESEEEDTEVEGGEVEFAEVEGGEVEFAEVEGGEVESDEVEIQEELEESPDAEAEVGEYDEAEDDVPAEEAPEEEAEDEETLEEDTPSED